MENTSKSNLEYQFSVILQNVKHNINEINTVDDIFELNCDEIIECMEGLKEIQVAIKTLKN